MQTHATIETLKQIAAIVTAKGWSTTVEYPGYLEIWHSNGDDRVRVGTANGDGFWGADDWVDRDGHAFAPSFPIVNRYKAPLLASASAEDVAAAILAGLANCDPSFCAFCGSDDHTDVIDCPEIDPEQLAIELQARKGEGA